MLTYASNSNFETFAQNMWHFSYEWDYKNGRKEKEETPKEVLSSLSFLNIIENLLCFYLSKVCYNKTKPTKNLLRYCLVQADDNIFKE